MKNHPMQNNVSGTLIFSSHSPHPMISLTPCIIIGHHILYGSPVSVYSKFNPQELADQRKTHDLIPHEQGREALGVLLQKIPLLGRGLAHLTSMSLFAFIYLTRSLHSCSFVHPTDDNPYFTRVLGCY